MSALSQSLEFAGYNTNTNSVQVIYPNQPDLPKVITFNSHRIPGDGYYGSTDGFHTVEYIVASTFVGTITTQASLATDPVESDWFPVQGTTATYVDNWYNQSTDSLTTVTNFVGNFVWIRGNIQIEDGAVEVIRVNH